ncbi:hypothetical protein HYPDE_36348 [Hyphomicrobium denitrificans 1NES1]|uniref:DUF4236 domain-containing protein n=1 Tax=Hyphomicrobium denitrificans 1NES1 TaxID=670307 RepID=N0BEM3_9HYPH|nr:DUF4236 domain-containing protein [Hyphomicrobium denitrificans]AGK58941.1 hypothetical protein HYPDE_36348 [Hyphomicrobium denitrificans 1NES1]
MIDEEKHMGYFRFRKTFSILPGVRINLSKTGVSSSIGGHGATVNVGKNGPMVTLGVPGTGLSYRTPISVALIIALVLIAAVAGLAYFFAPDTVRALLHWWQPRWF